MPQRAQPREQVPQVDFDHLVKEHGIDPAALRVGVGNRRDQRRHLALYYEMKHAADHAQRKVDHDHN